MRECYICMCEFIYLIDVVTNKLLSLSIVDSNGSVLPQEGGGGGYVEALLSVTSGEHLMVRKC